MNSALFIAVVGTVIVACGQLATAEHGIITCSFATDLCGWRHPAEEVYSWQRVKTAQSGGKPISATSTSIDDFFLFASGGNSHSLSHKDLAVIHSLEFFNPGPGALRFWHVSESPSQPGLYVNITQNGETKTIQKFLSFAHHWTERVVNVEKAGRTVLTIAAAPVGHGIDELEFTRDAEVAVFREIVVPFKRPLVVDAEVSCSFKDSFCGWTQFDGLPGSWKRGPVPSSFPAKFVKESSNHWFDGNFLTVQTTDEHTSGDAALVTSIIRQNTSSWISFWWAKHNKGHETSAVFVKVFTRSGTETLFYSKLPADNWIFQNVSIPQTGPIRLSIGFTLNSRQSIGVLDEVQYGLDESVPSTTPGYEVTTSTEGSGSIADDKEFFLF